MFTQISSMRRKLKSVLQLPFIEENEVILFAILVQNALHPKNAQRKEAITKMSYREIRTEADANAFLINLL